MTEARYLVDKSAFARLHIASVSAILQPLLGSGDSATCGMIQLEILFSARNTAEFGILRRTMATGLATIATAQADFDRAIEVMHLLSLSGHHRSLAIPDLIIGAVAERNNLTVLHYDQDFDRLSEVTRQPTMWVVPRGSI